MVLYKLYNIFTYLLNVTVGDFRVHSQRQDPILKWRLLHRQRPTCDHLEAAWPIWCNCHVAKQHQQLDA